MNISRFSESPWLMDLHGNIIENVHPRGGGISRFGFLKAQKALLEVEKLARIVHGCVGQQHGRVRRPCDIFARI